MEKKYSKGKAQTVLGLIEPDDLGVVLPHEHLFWRGDSPALFIEPIEPDEKEIANQAVCLGNLSWVRSHKVSNLDNLQLTDEETAICEAMRFKKAGGGTIVNVTSNNSDRNPTGLVRVAQVTGLNVIMGTAYYVEKSYHPEMHMNSRTEEDIAEEFVQDITVGVGDSGVRAGIIGELGCSWPLTKGERKVLRAAGIAQQHTGVVISVHPGTNPDAPLEIVKVLTDAGANPTCIIIGHIARTIASHNGFCKLAETGCSLEFDMFGIEGIYPVTAFPTPIDVPSDQGRIRQIIQLIAEGYLGQILISQDVCLKIQLSCFGGGGYSHILTTTIPVMLQKGVTKEQIHTIMVNNPKRLLALA